MMAAYQPTPGGVHPGLPHGHPGMGPNPGQQHMAQPMMQPGMSGAPHVSQPGAMVGMQPGAQGMGPAMGGHHPGGMPMQAQMGQNMAGGMPQQAGMSHMTPQQMALHQQMASNPQLAQQQHIMRMRQQQMMQAQANGMMGMHQGVPMTPQQLAQLQQMQQQQQHAQQQGVQGGNPSVQLPAHLQLQQQALQQQQQQQQRLAQQHAQQQQQLAQQMQMHATNSQQSNPGQPAQPNPQGQPNNPQQMRPQSRMANPNEQGQQNQQQHAQQGQAQQGQAQAQPTPQQGQQGNPQQAGQQPMTVQQRQQMMLMRTQHAAAYQRMQAAAQQQQQQQQQQQVQGQHPGMFILRLLHFSDHLGNFNEAIGKDISNWHNFVDKHFASDGRLIHSFEGSGNQSTSRGGKVFEVLRPTVARYFWTYFDSGCSSIRLHTEHAREVPHSSGGQSVLCQNATFSVSYPNGARLEMMGSLQVLFQAGTDSIECLQFQTSTTEEIVSRIQIEKVLTDWSPALPTKSPKMAKNKLPKAQAKMQEQQERLTLEHFPKTPKGTYGITSKVQQFLEIGETMNIMSDLMHYAQEKKLRPEHALEALNQQYEAERNAQGGNPQINLPPNGVAQGNRTPSMPNMQIGQAGNFSSPSVSNLNLPMQNGMNGSPHLGNNPGNLAPNMNMANSHTPSPHQSNMSAPPMVPQHSQQGTNSSAASANTSPNINNTNNKRRRSTVKLEGDDGGGADGQSGANRVKPSPRMSKKSKP